MSRHPRNSGFVVVPYPLGRMRIEKTVSSNAEAAAEERLHSAVGQSEDCNNQDVINVGNIISLHSAFGLDET